MTKRIFALIVALLMVATLFAACGDDTKAEKDDNKKTTTVAATAAPTEAATAAPTVAPTEAPTETLGAIPTDDSIVGTWTLEEDGASISYCFNADGTGYIDFMGEMLDITYEATEDTVTYTATIDGSSMTLNYYFQDGNLVLSDGEDDILFEKQ